MVKKSEERKQMENSLWRFGRLISTLLWCSFIVPACYMAYNIRLYAINTYGRVIHEFDPWFNMRATRYLRDNGWQKFFHWFDYKVWYPLGRPVGTTIYPGMQIASVSLWNILKYFSPEGQEMSLNDVCVFVPVWFGVVATIFLGLLTTECTGSYSAGIVGASIMAIIPAHIMRSVGGGYDNESVAMTAMMMTFYFWVRSLRNDKNIKNGEATRDSYIYGTLCGFAYIFMVATWGGFIFVLNLIAAHAVALVLMGRYSSKLHRAYSLFYIIGTIGATHVPVVGWGPLKSMEQLSGLAVFCAYQILEYCEIQRRKKNLNVLELTMLRVKVTIPIFGFLALIVAVLLPTGYFGPLTARIRGLFVKHTRTGNPLVDSVAEHQPASEAAYGHYLNVIYKIAPYGLIMCVFNFTDANLFLVSYAFIAYYFSSKMSRLIILLGPVGSALAGNAIGLILDQCFVYSSQNLMKFLICNGDDDDDDDDEEKKKKKETEDDASDKDTSGKKDDEKKKKKKEKKDDKKEEANDVKASVSATRDNTPLKKIEKIKKAASKIYNNPGLIVIRIVFGIFLINTYGVQQSKDFFAYCHQMAEGMSGPSIMFKARLNSGEEIIVDDYREAYWWLRDKTPDDARVLAWWDYGYQITGIGNRTSLADGNTWNHEHIATLGRMLSGPEKKSHRIIRHLADYVLVWAGGGGDDLAKSPHMARIGNSVYSDICPGDPTCSQFGFYQGGVPTPMMRKSLLYKLTQYGYREDIKLDPNRFMHVKTTKYGKVRIFKVMHVSQKSKKWIANPENRICDAPGSWYCTGQYPPALSKLIARRKDFSQLEDFNKKKDKQSEKYNEEYMKRMDGKSTGKRAKSGYGIDEEEDDEDPEPVLEPLAMKYVGCYGGEDDFGGKEYIGSSSGANIRLLHSIATEKKKQFIAIARVGSDGHSFVFDEKPGNSVKKMDDRGCGRLCVDDINYKCGCADANCDGVGKAPGEQHLRRWVVYEITDEAPKTESTTSSPKKMKEEKKKRKKKKKEERKKKDAEEAEKKTAKKEEKKKRKKKRKEEKKKKKKKKEKEDL
jgi:dolichyl-diphosphooligosaccharide--protein glycosyltransferase